MKKQWRYYHELRPAELQACLAVAPVAFWPLGMLEHHGWHLPIGLDGLKAEELCIRVAAQTGGVILPTMWWASGGGHGNFPWTHYQSPEATASILVTTAQQLISFGFKVIVLLAGHYPWQPLLDENMPALAAEFPDVLLLWGSEATIGAPEVATGGDHAGREETSFGLHLFPQRVEMGALTDSFDRTVEWPNGAEPAEAERHPAVCYDASQATFAQAGRDAREASAEHGKAQLEPLVTHLVRVIGERLEAIRCEEAQI